MSRHPVSMDDQMAVYRAARAHLIERSAVPPIRDLPSELLVDDRTYQETDLDLLRLFADRGRLWFLHFRRTGYFKTQHEFRGKSWLDTWRWTRKYWRVFASIRSRGYVVSDPQDPKAYPWAFCSREQIIRVDGHHRAAVCRFLQIPTVPTRVAFPSELLASASVPEAAKALIRGFSDPADAPAMTASSLKGITLVLYSLRCGGAERIMSGMANHWVQQGRPVTLITMADPATDFYPLDGRVARVPLGLADPAGNPLAFVVKRVRRWARLRRAIRNARHPVVLSFTTNLNNLAVAAAAGLRKRVIVVERNDPTQKDLPVLSRLWRRLLYPRAACVVVQTERVRTAWGRHLGRKVRVIPNFIDCSAPQDEGACPFRKPYVLGVGRLVDRKGFDLLIKAFAPLAAGHPEWTLVIAGDGPERAALERRIEEAGLSGRVVMPGTVRDIAPVYRGAGVFVLSSLYEGFPNVLLEAMCQGTAVVSFDCPSGPSEVIADGRNGYLVPVGDVNGLREKIELLMQDEPLRRRLGECARRDMDRFSVNAVMREWSDLVDRETR